MGLGWRLGRGLLLSKSCPKWHEKSVTSLYCMLEANLFSEMWPI